MKPFEIRQEIDLQRANLPLRYEQPLIKGNKGAHKWIVTVTEGGKAADLSGVGAMLWLKNGGEMSVIAQATIEGNAAQVLFGAACYAQAGEAIAVMELSAGGVVLGAAVLTLRVMDTKSDVVNDEESIVPSISDLLAEIAAMRAATEEANAAASNANTAAGEASTAAGKANTAAAKIDDMTVSASPSTTAGATISEKDGVKHITFSLPKGDKGDKGDPGTIENVAITSIKGLQEALDEKQPKGSYLTSESDPSVPAWAKKETKPSYTASEVGARPSSWIPTLANLTSVQRSSWTGETLPGGVPDGISFIQTTDGAGCPKGYATILSVKDNTARCFQIFVDKEIAMTYVRSGVDGATWGDWHKVYTDNNKPTPADIGALPSAGTAASATKLATARTIRTNLASTSAASFDGTGNATPGVTGTLPIGNGGTGATTKAAACTALGIMDYIVAQGTSGIWSYRKWNSGKAECWFKDTLSTVVNVEWGIWYESKDAYPSVAFPFTMSIESEAASVFNGSIGMMYAFYKRNSNSSPQVYIYRGKSSDTTYTFTISYYAIGTWK